MLSTFIHLPWKMSKEEKEKKGNYDNDCTRIFPTKLCASEACYFSRVSDNTRALKIFVHYWLDLNGLKYMKYTGHWFQNTFMQTHFLANSSSFVFQTSNNILHNVRFDFLIIMFRFDAKIHFWLVIILVLTN